MKKTIAILLVLVIGMVGVWADSTSPSPASADLLLKTKVDLVFDTKISDTTLESFTYADWESLGSERTEYTLEGTSATAFSNLYIRTNKTAGFDLEISSAEPLTATDIDTLIGYTITAGDASYTVNINDEDISIPVEVTTGISGATIKMFPLSVTLNPTDYNNAAASDDYQANITFTFTAK